MPTATQTKQAYLSELYERTAGNITGSLANWTGFLTTVGNLYKYPFHEQLMIYAQRPDATACAEYGLWNDTMNRYVHRGTKGIALIDATSNNPKIKYVFDVSDTGGRENSRRPFLWEMQSHHEQPILEMLEDKFGVSSDNLLDGFYNIAKDLAAEYYDNHKEDIPYLAENSFLEDYDEDNLKVAFETAATVSIAYTLMKRCGLDTESYFDHEDFSPIFDFTPPPLSAFWERQSANKANKYLGKYPLPSSKQSVKGATSMNEITYSRNGDYLIPDLTLTEQPTQPLGKYGRMRKTYLEEHRKALFSHLLLSEKLYPHLLEIDQTASKRLEQIMADLQKTQTPPDKLTQQMEWVGHMNNLKAQVEEMILTELVYS